MTESQQHSYRTQGGLLVQRTFTPAERLDTQAIVDRLESERGLYLASGYEYPGRYHKWEIGVVAPPLALTVRGQRFAIEALNARGEILLPAIHNAIRNLDGIAQSETSATQLAGSIARDEAPCREEERTRRPSAFSLVRAVIGLFASTEDSQLGLYGAFGYDAAFQFEPIRLKQDRGEAQRDIVLYLPDEIVVLDHRRETGTRFRYDFTWDGKSSAGLERTPSASVASDRHAGPPADDTPPGAYQETVKAAREAFARGDLFETVCSQLFVRPQKHSATTLYRRLAAGNPAPYQALINLGEGEALVSASPEMFVRVRGTRVETCPISGTIRRGRDALSDADQILALLNSTKDAAELTMCTDVDRNDKARVCEPGSVKVIGRRHIELYSRLIHTCDHVEGRLRDGLDAIDAFLTHAWAVTVTGAPKRWAIQFIEDHENSPRRWYGGAFGWLGFNGDADTGLTLRTLRLAAGRVEVRVGATLLYDSDPDEEHAECLLKGSALFAALEDAPAPAQPTSVPTRLPLERTGDGRRVLLVDHEDSFVHTLADYLRQTGATVETYRATAARERLGDGYDLVVLSPGPGAPRDFALSDTIDACLGHKLPIFGVCLGLQGLAEYFGGRLGRISPPMHGKASKIWVLGGRVFDGLPSGFQAGRYHSLHAIAASLPGDLKVTAHSEDGVVMAFEHERLPIAAVQFHPESILTATDAIGHQMIANVMRHVRHEGWV
ncbi:MAG: anthranilate synthase component I [Alphaproteobacteria bacterium]|nr:anthranilate synthase component I [Alphaproteobacteria bacterium]